MDFGRTNSQLLVTGQAADRLLLWGPATHSFMRLRSKAASPVCTVVIWLSAAKTTGKSAAKIHNIAVQRTSLRKNACSRTPGVWKVLFTAPTATISTSYGTCTTWVGVSVSHV